MQSQRWSVEGLVVLQVVYRKYREYDVNVLSVDIP